VTIEMNVLEPTLEQPDTEGGDTPSQLMGTLEAAEAGLKEGLVEARETIADAAHAVQDAVRDTGDAVENAFVLVRRPRRE
jgi:hypothetical protein